MSAKERLRCYRKFFYEVGSLDTYEDAAIASDVLCVGERAGFEVAAADRSRCRTRYFTDSGVIGKKAFVVGCYQKFKTEFASRHEKRPRPIAGLDGVYSLKRLSEAM